MRMSELVGKEIINIVDGARLGVIGESDLSVDIDTGQIMYVILPRRTNILNFWVDKQQMQIPWDMVRKIGNEVIIVEIDQGNLNFQRYSV
ncbi:MAG: YlmC/YmxH family sporulation protein [Desulfotomaculum sp.]|nr:YlmC/YmxH family sporulation protein [Desulfotomaculum sp.]